jgi:hypothetical protein
MKAQGHKYFKREPKASGGYKYYYTEAQYKKEKGGGEEKKETKSAEDEKKLSDFQKLVDGGIHISRLKSGVKDLQAGNDKLDKDKIKILETAIANYKED